MSAVRTVALAASVSRLAGGPFESIRGLAAGLRLAGAAVDVLGIRDAFTADDLAAWAPLEPLVFDRRGPASFGYAPGYGAALHRLAPAIVHSHGLWMYPSLAALRWHNRTGRPYVVSPHGMLDPWALAHHRRRKQVVGLLFEQAHLRRAACLRALCDSERASMRALGLTRPVCVIPNGIDLPPVEVPPVPPPWPEAFGRDRRVLLYLGRLHPKKNLPALLRAWQQVGGAAAGWRLVVAGWDQLGHAARLREQAGALGLQADIHFPGPLHGEAKTAALRGADAFVLPSLSEGLPMAVLEAWAASRPVLLTPACNLPEGARAGAAIEVRPDPHALAEGLRRLFALTDPARAAMGRHGRELVERRFTWDRIGAEMLAVYRWILDGGPVPSCVETAPGAAG